MRDERRTPAQTCVNAIPEVSGAAATSRLTGLRIDEYFARDDASGARVVPGSIPAGSFEARPRLRPPPLLPRMALMPIAREFQLDAHRILGRRRRWTADPPRPARPRDRR